MMGEMALLNAVEGLKADALIQQATAGHDGHG
jgi:hypothetical protein